MANTICGVDVSSKALDAQVGRSGPFQRFARNAEGIAELVGFCRAHGVELVVMEATGGYERLAFALLWEAGLPTAIVNPRAVRDFARGMGFLEKTDRLDAGIIARYASVAEIAAQQPTSCEQRRLTALVTRLRQLTDLRTAQANQRRLVDDKTILASIDEIVALINRQIRTIEAEISSLVDQDPLWAKLDTAFRTIKGVADRTVAGIMAHLPEIGTLSNKAAAKLAGLAPLARDSGLSAGKRSVRGGRRDIRDLLFIVAEVVRRHEPDFQDCYQKMLAAGKPKKVIRVALARKLLVRLNAKARDTRKHFALAT